MERAWAQEAEVRPHGRRLRRLPPRRPPLLILVDAFRAFRVGIDGSPDLGGAVVRRFPPAAAADPDLPFLGRTLPTPDSCEKENAEWTNPHSWR